jgi:hypothetical protein
VIAEARNRGGAESVREGMLRAWLVAAVLAAAAAGCGGSRVEDAPLDSVVVPDRAGTALVVTGTHGACDTVLAAEVVETAEQVSVRCRCGSGRGRARRSGCGCGPRSGLRSRSGTGS